eukprot:PhF_6_TR22252/c0_g1_i1/m.31433
MDVSISLDRSSGIFDVHDKIKGVIILECDGPQSHSGIQMTIDGSVALQLSPKSVGIFEAFYNNIKPLQLVGTTVSILDSGKAPGGVTKLPFEFDLLSLKKPGVVSLCETYHGVFVNSSYHMHIHVNRGMFGKSIKESLQIYVRNPGQAAPTDPAAYTVPPTKFALQPAGVKNIRKQSLENVPQFKISGQLDTALCDITKPLTGTVKIEECAIGIKSVEVQLVRVEFCAAVEGVAKEATEIQNIQIGEGDVPRGIDIPIFMIFPRWFTCPTLVASNFKVEFELNLVVLLEDNHQITENFPIRLYRPTTSSL